jgi:hypothetical protein
MCTCKDAALNSLVTGRINIKKYETMTVQPDQFSDEFVDDQLFRGGLSLASYFIRKSPYSETICYTNSSGKQFYLSIGNDDLMRAILSRLHRLGAVVVNL